MTNPLEAIKEEIRSRLATAGVYAVLTYPDDVSRMGNLFPMGIIQSQNADILSTANMQMLYDYVVNIYIVTQAGITQSKTHEDLVFAVLNSMYKQNDNRLGNTAENITPTSVNFNADFPYISADQNALQTSMIQFTIKVRDTR